MCILLSYRIEKMGTLTTETPKVDIDLRYVDFINWIKNLGGPIHRQPIKDWLDIVKQKENSISIRLNTDFFITYSLHREAEGKGCIYISQRVVKSSYGDRDGFTFNLCRQDEGFKAFQKAINQFVGYSIYGDKYKNQAYSPCN